MFGQVTDNAVRIVKGGTIGSTDESSTAIWTNTDSVTTYGSSTDLWGQSWTAADINSPNFGTALSAAMIVGGPGGGGASHPANIDSVTITVYYTAKLTPVISWPTPAAITYGTALTSTQLDATAADPNTNASVAGTFTYSPAAGTVLNAGTQTLNVTFTPTDTTDYNTATASVSLQVNTAALTVTANSKTKAYGAALPTLDGTLSGVVNGDNITASYSTLATSGSDVSANGYAITPTLNDPNNRLGNYTVTTNSGTLTVVKAYQNISWSTPAVIAYGTALGASQLDASVSGTGPAPAGSLSYSPAAGTVLAAGSQALTVTAAGTLDYLATTASVTLVVNGAPTTTQLQSSAASAAFDQSVTFTATVTASGGTPTGIVAFFDGNGALLGTAALSAGSAALDFAALTIGNHAITAVYSGAGNFAASASASVNQAVTAAGGSGFDPAAQFSATTNANGPWDLGYETALGNAATFMLFSHAATTQGVAGWNGQLGAGGNLPQAADNGTASSVQIGTGLWAPGELALQPGPAGQFAIVSFVAPAAGTYAVAASFFASDSSPDGSDVHVVLNGTALFAGTTSAAASAAFDSQLLTLNVGDRIDFAVGYGPNDDAAHALTGLQVSIATTQNLGPVAAAASFNVPRNASLTETAANGVLASVTNPAHLVLTAALVAGPAHGTLQLNADGSFTYTPTNGYTGTDTFTYDAADGTSTSSAATVTFTVANWPPAIDPIPAQNTAEGATVNLAVSAHSPDADPLTYSAAGLPVGLAINSQGVIAGIVDYADAETNNGSYSVIVTVADDQGGTTSQTVAWTVTDTPRPPVLAAVANQSDAEGNVVSLALSVSNPDGFPLTYTLSGAPAGLQVTSAGVIAGTIDYSAAQTNGGQYTVTATAIDSRRLQSSRTFAWTVADTPRLPVIPTIAAPTNLDSDVVSLALNATDADGYALHYTLNGAPAGLAISSAGVIGGTIDAAASQTNGGNYTVTVAAIDSRGLEASQTFTWTVNPYTPPAVSIASVAQAITANGPTDFVFTVTLASADLHTATVSYQTQDDSATVANGDYDSTSSTLTFNPGVTSQTIDVTVNGDTTYAPARDFFVVLSNPTNTSLGVSEAAGTILHAWPTVTTAGTAWTDSANGPQATLTATVGNNPAVVGSGQAPAPTGSVQFLVNGVAFGPAVPLSNGTASLAAPDLPPGFTLSANYLSGSPAQFSSSSAAVLPAGAGPNVFYDDFSTGAADLANYDALGALPSSVQIDNDALHVQNQGTLLTADLLHFFTNHEMDHDFLATIDFTQNAPVGPVAGTWYYNGIRYDWNRYQLFEIVGMGADLSDTTASTDAAGDTYASAWDVGTPLTDPSLNATAGHIGQTETLQILRIGGQYTLSVVEGGTETVLYQFEGSTAAANRILLEMRAVNAAYDLAVTNFTVIPLLHNDSYTVPHDQLLAVDQYDQAGAYAANGVLANDSGWTPFATTLTVVQNVQHGTLKLDNDGSFYYLPNPGFVGTDSFVYQVNNAGTATAVIDVTDTPPVANDVTIPTPVPRNGDLQYTTSILTNDTAAYGDSLTAALVSGPAHGSVVLETDGTFTYRANAGYSGQDSFTYDVNDGALTSTPATVYLTVAADQAPTAQNASYSTTHDQWLTVDSADGLLQNAAGADPSVLLSAVLAAGPSHGMLDLAPSGAFQYVPDAGFYGEDHFTYQVSDGTLTSSAATVALDVTESAPTGAAASFQVLHGHSLIVGVDQGLVQLGSDADGDTLTADIVAGPTHGTLTLYGQGAFRYVPNPAYSGPDSFTYELSDGLLDSPTYTVSLSVTDQAPVAVNNAYTVAQDHGLVANLWQGVLASASDADGDRLTAQLVSNVSHGTLTLNPDGSFVYTPSAGFSGTDTFTYHAFDGSLTSNTATTTITVNPAQAGSVPVGQPDSYQLLHDTILTVPAWQGVLANDSGSNTITDGPLTATLVQTTSHGTLTLNIGGSFQYMPDPGFAGTDTFTYRVANSVNQGNVSTVTLTVTDAAPTASASSYTLLHDTVLTVAPSQGVLAGASDADADPRTAQLVSGSSHGTLSLQADGMFTYTPTAGYVGTDSFSIRASDGILGSSPVTVSLNITDNAPTVHGVSYEVIAGTPLFVPWYRGLLTTAADADSDPLTAQLVAGPAHGSVTVNADGSFTYTAATGYTGADSFTYAANDGALPSSPATVTLTVFAASSPSSPAPVTYTGTPGDVSPPIVYDAAFSLLHDTTLNRTQSGNGLLASAIDPQGFPLLAYLVTDVSHGSLGFLSDGGFLYQPDPGYLGTDSFTYAATNGLADSSAATVTLTVTDAAPVAVADSYTFHAGAPGTPLSERRATGLLANDTDPDGDFLTASIQTGPQHGALIANPDGSFRYTPDAGFVGTDTFTYTASDGVLTSNTATVTIHVTDTAPVTAAACYTVLHDTTLIASESPSGILLPGASDTTSHGLLSSDTDAAGDLVSASEVTGPSHGSLVFSADGAFRYTPSAGYVGTDSFTYTVSDGTLTSAPATVTLTVTDAAPTVTAPTYSTLHDTPLLVSPNSGLLSTAADADSDTLTLDVTARPTNGTLAWNADGSFEYIPNAHYVGDDTFTFTVSDGALSTGPVTATIHVTDAAPTAPPMSFTLTHDTPLLIDASAGLLSGVADADGDELTLVNVTNPTHGSLTWEPTGAYYYQPDAHYAGDDSFTYAVSDGALTSGTVTVTLHVQNSAPVVQNASYSVLHDTELALAASSTDPDNLALLANASDADGDPLTIQLASGPTNGTLDLKLDGGFIYTPNAGFVGTDTFTYRLSDGVTTSALATATIAVANSPPVASDYSFSVARNGILSVATVDEGLLSNVSDDDGDSLTTSLDAGPGNGTVVLRPDGTFLYTPNAGFVGTDTFTYDVSDGSADDVGTVTIDVTDDAPQVTGTPSFEVTAGAPFSVGGEGLLAYAADPDGAALTAALASGASDGSIVVNADGSFTYTPVAGYLGNDSFSFTVSDGVDATAPITVSLAVVNDPFASQESEAAAQRDAAIASANAELATSSRNADRQRVLDQFNDNATYNSTAEQQDHQYVLNVLTAEEGLWAQTVNSEATDDSAQQAAWLQSQTAQQSADIAAWTSDANADNTYLAAGNTADAALTSADLSAETTWQNAVATADAQLQSGNTAAWQAQQTVAAQAEDAYNTVAVQAQAEQLVAQGQADQAEQQAWLQASAQETNALAAAQAAYQQEIAGAKSALQTSRAGADSAYTSAVAAAQAIQAQAWQAAQSAYDDAVQQAQAEYGTTAAALPDLSGDTAYQDAIAQAQATFDTAVGQDLTQYEGSLSSAQADRSFAEQSAQDAYNAAVAGASQDLNQANLAAAGVYQNDLLSAQISRDDAVTGVQSAYRTALQSADAARQNALQTANLTYDTATTAAGCTEASAVVDAQAARDVAEQSLALAYATTTSAANQTFQDTLDSDEAVFENTVADATGTDAQSAASAQNTYYNLLQIAENAFTSAEFIAQTNHDNAIDNSVNQYQLTLNIDEEACDLAVAADDANYENNLAPDVQVYDHNLQLADMLARAAFAAAELQAIDTQNTINAEYSAGISGQQPPPAGSGSWVDWAAGAINAAFLTLAEGKVQAQTLFDQGVDSSVQAFLAEVATLTSSEATAVSSDLNSLANEVAAADQLGAQATSAAAADFDQATQIANNSFLAASTQANTNDEQELVGAGRAYAHTVNEAGRDADVADEAAQVVFDQALSQAATVHDDAEAQAAQVEVTALATAVQAADQAQTDAWTSWSIASAAAQRDYQVAWAHASADQLSGVAQANTGWQAGQLEAGAQETAALDQALVTYQNALLQAAASSEQDLGQAAASYAQGAAAAWNQWLGGSAGYGAALATEQASVAQAEATAINSWAQAQGTPEASLLAGEIDAQSDFVAATVAANSERLQAYAQALTDRGATEGGVATTLSLAVADAGLALVQAQNTALADTDKALAAAAAARLVSRDSAQATAAASVAQGAAARAIALANGEHADTQAVFQDIEQWLNAVTSAEQSDDSAVAIAFTTWIDGSGAAAQADEQAAQNAEQSWLTATENIDLTFSNTATGDDSTWSDAVSAASANLQLAISALGAADTTAVDAANQILENDSQACADAELVAIAATGDAAFRAVTQASPFFNSQLANLKGQADTEGDAAAAAAGANTPPMTLPTHDEAGLDTLFQQLGAASRQPFAVALPTDAGTLAASLSLAQVEDRSQSAGTSIFSGVVLRQQDAATDVQTLAHWTVPGGDRPQFVLASFASGAPGEDAPATATSVDIFWENVEAIAEQDPAAAKALKWFKDNAGPDYKSKVTFGYYGNWKPWYWFLPKNTGRLESGTGVPTISLSTSWNEWENAVAFYEVLLHRVFFGFGLDTAIDTTSIDNLGTSLAATQQAWLKNAAAISGGAAEGLLEVYSLQAGVVWLTLSNLGQGRYVEAALRVIPVIGGQTVKLVLKTKVGNVTFSWTAEQFTTIRQNLRAQGKNFLDFLKEEVGAAGSPDALRALREELKAGQPKGAIPPWLKERFDAGQAFDRANRSRYPHNEVEVSVDGKTFKVDSLNPAKGEIVFRRLTQLAEVEEKTAVGYLNEFARKYPPGAKITDSPFNPRVLQGKELTGQLIFEVPVQIEPVPQAVLDAATNRNIIIRDVAGKVYNP